jgi:two-component system sensor histidine kinase QseC
MRRWRTISLQWRLTLGLLLATALVWGLVLVLTWTKTKHEIDELLDAHLAQTAAVLLAQVGDGHDSDDFTTTPLLHRYQQRVAYQIWHEDELLSHSAQAPTQALAPGHARGRSVQVVGGQYWLVFTAQGQADDVVVHVAELAQARDDILSAGLHSAIAPLLLAMPVLALLIGAVVHQALRGIRQTGQAIAARQPQALTPVPDSGVSEIQPLIDALNQLFARVTRTLDQEKRFTADAAHELRTPLAAIRMQAQVAQGARDDAERQQALASVLRGCDRLTRLVEQLLQLARLEAQASLAVEPAHDARSEVGETLMSLQGLARQRQQTLTLEASAPVNVAIPAAHMGVLVRNLVDNALRYSPVGGQVMVRLDGPSACLEVHDSGPGLTTEQRERLGQRFYRAPGTQAEGSGLGWSIVLHLAQLHGITWQLQKSAELDGLMVRLCWPRA